jgi:hypothetical protein
MESAVNPPYPSQDDIQKAIEVLEISALKLDPNSEEHKSLMGELAALRAYGEMNGWLRPLAPKPNSLKD